MSSVVSSAIFYSDFLPDKSIYLRLRFFSLLSFHNHIHLLIFFFSFIVVSQLILNLLPLSIFIMYFLTKDLLIRREKTHACVSSSDISDVLHTPRNKHS